MNTSNVGQDLAQINQDFETRAAEARAQELGLPFVDLTQYPINPDVLKLISPDMAESAKAVPFHKNGRALRVAVTDPNNAEIATLRHHLEKDRYTIELYLCSESGLAKVYDLFDSELVQRKTVEVRHDFKELSQDEAVAKFKNFSNVLGQLDLVPVTQALNEIQIAAVQFGASDIHLQPYADHGELRLRIDGVLQTVGQLPADKTLKIVAQIKYEAGMKANIKDVPQDGHLAFEVNDRLIDLRVSSLPTEYGESMVLRVLDSSRGIKSFTDLGFDAHKEQKILEVLKHKNGMVLVTGPTGSGKTTTLYAMLKELNTDDKKLVTLEDPIEYHLDNVIQSQVRSEGKYNFSNGLKALLRHDPDVMLIGEIRDLATAKLATEASLTGHVVLSSLHTNSALGAVTRLRNLGLESFNIGSSLNAVFAQRLVRKVCPHCATKRVIRLSDEDRFKTAFDRVLKVHPELRDRCHFVDEVSTSEVHKPKDQLEILQARPNGCDQCAETGFNGQTVIAEVAVAIPKLQAAITEGSPEHELVKILQQDDASFLTLFEDAVRKMILGETTLKEVYRVAG